MNARQPSFWELAVKTAVTHTITYFTMGLLASTFLNYAERFARPEIACWIRQTSDPIVMAGPLFQPLRGLLFAVAFFPLREVLFGKKNGWWIISLLLIVFGILSPFGPTPGSVEGMIYSIIPISDQLTGLLEVIPQALLLAALLTFWVNNPQKRWLNWLLGIVFVIIVLLLLAGLLTTVQ